MVKNKVEDAPCPKCVADISMGFFFKVCNDSLSHKINCKTLNKQFLRGELTSEKVIEKIKAAAQDDPEVTSDLEEIERIRKTGKI
jgi:hypothetical protein